MKALEPTSTRRPPFTSSVTTPPMARCLGERAFQRAPILGPLHFDGRKRVGAFRIPPRDADAQLVAHLHRQLARRVAKHFHRQHAVHLASDVHEDGFGRDRNHRAFQRLAVGAAVVLLLELGQDVGERILVWPWRGILRRS